MRAAAPHNLIPTLFLKLPDGNFAAQAPDLQAGFEAGQVILQSRQARYKLTFEGSRTGAVPEGIEPLATRVSYFTGSESEQWQTSLPAFAGVCYRQLYPGIDMMYRAAGRLKSEFIVAPGADPSRIRMRFGGSEGLTVDSRGNLRIRSAGGDLRDEQLEVFQLRAGKRVIVPARFVLLDNQVAGFEIESWDRTAELVIDPVLSFSSYLGGSRVDQATAVAVDASGAAFIAGFTDSQTFPVVSSLRIFSGSVEAFVMKVSPSGTVQWATFLGGSGDDRALGIGIDPTGNSYVVGYTTSSNFPTASPLQANKSGGRDAFVTKINPAGSAIVYSTYWGGSSNDQANAVVVDPYGQPYVVGDTDSPNFPTLFPFRSALGGLRDAFHFKIGVNGSMSYSTYVGGSGDDRGMAVGISDNLTPYMAGCTTSTDFPVLNALQSTNRGGQDAFVMRFHSDADALIYSTYLGGNGGATGQSECANSMAIDAYHNAYVVGITSSTNFPFIAALQNSFNGGVTDGFFSKIDSGGVLLMSTYIGGAASDTATGVRVDSALRAYVTGYTASKNLPTANPLQAALSGGNDGFLMRYETLSVGLDFGTFFGGTGSDTPTGLGLLPGGSAFIVGVTNSSNFPRQTPFQTNFAGATDGFIAKITGF